MDLNEIKNLIERDKGKFIIIENEKPTLVIMDFESYKRCIKIKNSNPFIEEEGSDDLKSRNTPNTKEISIQRELPEELKEEPLKIEDLPV